MHRTAVVLRAFFCQLFLDGTFESGTRLYEGMIGDCRGSCSAFWDQ